MTKVGIEKITCSNNSCSPVIYLPQLIMFERSKQIFFLNVIFYIVLCENMEYICDFMHDALTAVWGSISNSGFREIFAYCDVFFFTSVAFYLLIYSFYRFGTFFETGLTFSKLQVESSQLFAETPELYFMSANILTHPKHLIHVSKTSYCVKKIGQCHQNLSWCEPHIKVFSCFLTMTVNCGNGSKWMDGWLET